MNVFFERRIKKIIKIKQWSKGAYVVPNSVVGPYNITSYEIK
jgi:hypothetical protein